MVIKEELPFTHCDKCKNFVLDVDMQSLYADDGIVTRVITASCKNAWLCKQLKEDIRKEIQHDATGT